MKPLNINQDIIEKSMSETHWDFGNGVLYDLCKNNPEHKEPNKIIAKVWLIGRAYAASVERQKKNDLSNEKYYNDFIVSKLRYSFLDEKLNSLKEKREVNVDNLSEILSLHKYLITLLKDDSTKESEQNRRSFASKYLHFHLPELFFIYDSIASNALKEYTDCLDSNSLKRLKRSYHNMTIDATYAYYYVKCYLLKERINEEYDKKFNIRHLDNLLLYYTSAKN